MLTQYEGLPPINSYNLLNMCSQEATLQIETCFHYHKVYGHKTSQGGDIPQGAPTHKFGHTGKWDSGPGMSTDGTLKLRTRELKMSSWDLGPPKWDSGPRTPKAGPGTRNPKSQTQDFQLSIVLNGYSTLNTLLFT